MISIHALREEGDQTKRLGDADGANFYPRPPRGGRHHSAGQSNRHGNFYPRPPRGGRLGSGAMRGGIRLYFYPRPPRGGRRKHTERSAGNNRFLSTPSARRATRHDHTYQQGLEHFYPRPPRGGRPGRTSARKSIPRFLSTPSARRATAKTETKSLFSYKLYNILHEFRRALIYNGSKNDPNHAKRHKNPVRRCRKNAENSPFAPGRETQNNSRPSCSKGG